MSETYPIRNVPLSTAEQSNTVPEQKLFRKQLPSVNRNPIRYTFCDTPFHYPVQCEHGLRWSLVPKIFAGLYLNTSIISLLICMCVQNLQVCCSAFRLGPFGANLYLLI